VEDDDERLANNGGGGGGSGAGSGCVGVGAGKTGVGRARISRRMMLPPVLPMRLLHAPELASMCTRGGLSSGGGRELLIGRLAAAFGRWDSEGARARNLGLGQ
jgi:hypothetical protein